MKLLKNIAKVLLCFTIAANTLPVMADTANVSHSTNPGGNVTGTINETPAGYKFSLPGSNRTYVLVDTFLNAGGQKEFFVVTDYTASAGIAGEAIPGSNRYCFSASGYTWDGTSNKYIWDPADTNTMAGFINSSGFISEMIDETVNTYVVEHSYKFEPAYEATASAKSEVSSRYALLSLSELNAYKDRIGVLPCEYNVSTDVMTTTSNSWWVRTPAVSGGAGAMIWHKGNAKPAWQEAINAWGKTIRPCFYLSEDFFKNIKLDATDLGTEVVKMVGFEGILSKTEMLDLGYTETELNALGIVYPEITSARAEGLVSVGSGLTAVYNYTHSKAANEGNSLIEWIRVNADGGETTVQSGTEKTYTLTAADLGCKIYYNVTPKTTLGHTGLKVKSEATAAVEEGLCTLEGFSITKTDAQYSISLEGLAAKQQGISLKAVLTVRNGYTVVGSDIKTVGTTQTETLSATSCADAYIRFGIYNAETNQPLLVMCDGNGPVPNIEDETEFKVTPYPLENAMVAHGTNTGFGANTEVILKAVQILPGGGGVVAYTGADVLDENGRLLHIFSFADNIPAGNYRLTVTSGNASKFVEFLYSSSATKANVLENQLGTIDSGQEFATVVGTNLVNLGISDKYIVAMDETKLKATGDLLVGKSYNINTLSDFYNDISDAAAICEMTRNDSPYEVAQYYQDRLDFESLGMYAQFQNLEDSLKVYDMFKGKTATSFDDIHRIFNSSVVLQMINEAESYGKVDEILGTYEAYVTFSLLAYKNSDTTQTSLYVFDRAGEYTSMSQLDGDITDAITLQNQRPQGGGSGGGGGGGLGTIVKDEIVEKPQSVTVPQNQPVTETKPAVATAFADVSKDFWAHGYISELKNAGIISGDEKGFFNPDNTVTREEFVKMIIEAIGGIKEDAVCDFSDVPADNWARRYIAEAARLGIVNGKGDGSFGLGESISRQDMAVMICSAMDVEAEAAECGFNDAGEISEYANAAVRKLSAAGVINGFDDNTFKPLKSMNRAEAATVIYRLINRN